MFSVIRRKKVSPKHFEITFLLYQCTNQSSPKLRRNSKSDNELTDNLEFVNVVLDQDDLQPVRLSG